MSGFRKSHVILRKTGGGWVNGKWIAGDLSTLNIFASVQPAKMEDLVSLPEGRRLSDFIRLYTSTELRTVAEGTFPVEPDLFDWHGHSYECVQVGMWQNDVISHWKCIFAKVSQS